MLTAIRYYIRLGTAITPLLNRAATDELIAVAKDGQITWSDWMRVGRKAKLEGSKKR
jgi:hypothetical protein